MGRMLELSESTKNADCLYVGRQQEIERLPSLRKHSAKAILSFATRYPQAGHRALDAAAALRGYSFLGSGVEYSAYLRKRDERVVKVNRASANREPDYLVELQEQVRSQHMILADYLGSIVTTSDVYIAEHILGGGHQMLQIEQVFVDTTTHPLPFTSQSPEVNLADIDNLVTNIPGADVALDEFCAATQRLFEAENVLPDTNGRDNVVVQSSGDIALIDTIPIDRSHPAVQDLIMKQVASLETALKEVA